MILHWQTLDHTWTDTRNNVMKKAIMIISLCIVSFVFGILFNQLIPNIKIQASALETHDGINRTTKVLYPKEKYEWFKVSLIYPQINDKYYHRSEGYCDFADPTWDLDPLVISTYEAIERGFSPCPNCVYPEVEIYTGQWNMMLKGK